MPRSNRSTHRYAYHLVCIRNICPFLDGRTGPHPLLPGLQCWEVFNVDTRPPCCADPSPVSNICNGTFVAHQVTGLGIGEMLV